MLNLSVIKIERYTNFSNSHLTSYAKMFIFFWGFFPSKLSSRCFLESLQFLIASISVVYGTRHRILQISFYKFYFTIFEPQTEHTQAVPPVYFCYCLDHEVGKPSLKFSSSPTTNYSFFIPFEIFTFDLWYKPTSVQPSKWDAWPPLYCKNMTWTLNENKIQQNKLLDHFLLFYVI